jgi:aspartate racemase
VIPGSVNLRKIGLIGGMSWLSTRTYYEHVNRLIWRKMGHKASAPMLIENLDFSELSRLSTPEEWQRASDVGANSMHKVYDAVAASVSVPVLHIAECVGERMARNGVKKAALLGTRNVMIESFYRQKLISRDIELLPPDMLVVDALDRIIYDELIIGKMSRQSERELKSFITNFAQQGAQAVVLGCTELEMIVDVDANVLPIYDCTRIHAEAAADWILGGS